MICIFVGLSCFIVISIISIIFIISISFYQNCFGTLQMVLVMRLPHIVTSACNLRTAQAPRSRLQLEGAVVVQPRLRKIS